jgi:predicted GNAT family N-acyltransferase
VQDADRTRVEPLLRQCPHLGRCPVPEDEKGQGPGTTGPIVSSGTSAGGVLSALLGASAEAPVYQPYLAALGTAQTCVAIFAVGNRCPITDVDHADVACEKMWRTNPPAIGATADSALSQSPAAAFPPDQASLSLLAADGWSLTADTLRNQLLTRYLIPEATAFLTAVAEADRTANLAAQTKALGDSTSLWIYWDAGHGANEDTEAFLDWISAITGHPRA